MNSPEIPTHEMLQEKGRLMKPTESVSLDVQQLAGRESNPDGFITAGEMNIPFVDIAKIRMGGESTYVDLSVIAVPHAERGFAGSTMYFVQGDSEFFDGLPVPISAFEHGIIGRNSSRNMPNTISRNHVRLSTGALDSLTIENLNPTNATHLFLFDPQNATSFIPFKRPDDDMSATRAINPITGETTNGLAVDHAQDSEEERHRRKRARQRRQLGARAIR